MSQENMDMWSSKYLSREHRRVEEASQRLMNGRQKKKLPTPALLLLLLAVGAACFYFAKQNDYISFAASILIAIGSLIGFSFGVSHILGSLVGILAAIKIAPGLGIAKESLFTEWFSTTGILNRAISVGTFGILITIVGGVIASVILKFIFEARPKWSWGNHWLGLLFGGLKSAVAILFLLGGIQTIEPLYQTQNEQLQAMGDSEEDDALENVKYATSAVLTVAEKTRESALGPLVEKYNPFEMFPQLNSFNKIQKSVTVMQDPGFVSGMLQHPSIQELAKAPEVRETIDQLLESESFKNMTEKQEFGRPELMELLKQPAVLKLIETPGFLEKANAIIEEASLETANAN